MAGSAVRQYLTRRPRNEYGNPMDEADKNRDGIRNIQRIQQRRGKR